MNPDRFTEWLHDVHPHITEPSLLDTWHRIVDNLIVASDGKVRDLADWLYPAGSTQ